MSRHPLDNLFRTRLSRHSMDPPMHVWERVAAQRRQRRLRRYFYRGGLSLMLLGAGLAGWLTYQGEPVPPVSGFPVAQLPPATADVPPAEGTVEAKMAPALREGTLLTGSLSETARPPLPPTAASRQEEASLPAAAQAAQKRPATSRQPVTAASEPAPRAARPTRLPGGNPTELEQPAKTPVLAPRPQGQPAAMPPVDYNSRPAGPHQRDRSQTSRLLPLPQRPTPEVLPLEPQAHLATPTANCPRFGHRRHHLEAELLVGPGYAEQQLGNRGSESLQHLRDREATESPGLSYTSGLRLTLTHQSGWTIRSGIALTAIRDDFRHEVEGESMIVIRERYDANGNVIGRDTAFESATTVYSRTNELQLLEVPLLVGYEFRYGRLRLGVNAGAFFNLHFDASGEFLSPVTNEPVPFGQPGEEGVVPAFRPRAGTAFYGSLTALYHLGGRYSLLVEPFLKSYPQSFTRPEYALSQTYWMSGVQMGLRMRL